MSGGESDQGSESKVYQDAKVTFSERMVEGIAKFMPNKFHLHLASFQKKISTVTIVVKKLPCPLLSIYHSRMFCIYESVFRSSKSV